MSASASVLLFPEHHSNNGRTPAAGRFGRPEDHGEPTCKKRFDFSLEKDGPAIGRREVASGTSVNAAKKKKKVRTS